MSFLDSSSSIIDAVLTRKGRELLAKNDGSFRIAKFAFGDDEINYQLYNLAADDDSDILNLPILEPSTNEDSALRYRLVTLAKGTVAVASLSVNPNNLMLGRIGTLGDVISSGVATITTIGGVDMTYTVITRNARIANTTVSTIASSFNITNNTSTALLFVIKGNNNGTTIIDIVGNDTGAASTLVVTVV